MKSEIRKRILTFVMLSTALSLLLFVGRPTLAVAAEITSATVSDAIESAKTAADYQAVAAYYRKQAAEQEDLAKLHEKMLSRFKTHGKPRASTDMSAHCKNIIDDARKLSGEYEAMAKMYDQMAKEAAPN